RIAPPHSFSLPWPKTATTASQTHRLSNGCRGDHFPRYSRRRWLVELKQQARPAMPFVLLQFDACAGVFKLLLDLLGFVLANSFLDRLRSGFHQILGFLEAKTGDRADFLNDVDLLLAGSDKNDV